LDCQEGKEHDVCSCTTNNKSEHTVNSDYTHIVIYLSASSKEFTRNAEQVLKQQQLFVVVVVVVVVSYIV
jgi:hypothetical protein